MIGKLIKGRGARGVLDYLLASNDSKGDERPRVQIVGGTFAGRDAREISAEFGALHRLRPKLGVHVIHECLRLPDDEVEPDNATWAAIAQSWSDEMGIDDFVAVAHGDGHIHIAASRIKRDGSVVSDQHDYKRSEAAIRKIEINFGLTVVESSHLLDDAAAIDHHKAPTKGQMIYAELNAELPPAMSVAALIDEIIAANVTVTDFIAQLEAADVRIYPSIASTGRMNGFAYELDSIRFTSKAMGRGFTWANLQKRGLSYEPSRDDEALSAAKSRRQVEASELIGTEGGDRASFGRDQNVQSIRDRHGARRAEDTEATRSNQGVRPAGECERSENGPSDIGRNRTNGIHSDDLDRLVYLAAAELGTSRHEGPTNSGKSSDIRGDTKLAKLANHLARDLEKCGEQVGQFIQSIGANRYEVMTRLPDSEDGKIKRLTWSAEEMLLANNVRFLRAQNARGAGIYVRALDRRITIIDDLTHEATLNMTQKGFEPSACVETSQSNFQAWLRLLPADAPEPNKDVATQAARSLTKIFGGDVGAIGSARFGRLPGFTNRKAKHKNHRDRSPWVTLRSAAYRVAAAGQSFIKKIEGAFNLRAKRLEDEAKRRFIPAGAVSAGSATISFNEAEALFLRGLEYSSAELDLTQSEIDFRACGFAIKHGSTEGQIEAALLKFSPDIETRHKNTTDYVERTVRKAASSEYARGAWSEGPSSD